MRPSYSNFVLSTVLLACPCLAEDESDIPVAVCEIRADATRPENVLKRFDDLQTPNLDRVRSSRDLSEGQGSFFRNRPTLAQVASPPPSVAMSPSLDVSNLPVARLRPSSWNDDSDIYNQRTVVTVNGEPILMGEILDRHVIYLRGLREDLQRQGRTQADYNKQRASLVLRDLPDHIQRRLLAAAFMAHLSPRQILEVDTYLNGRFVKQEEPRLMQQLGVTTRDELESTLENAGGSSKYTRKNYLTMNCSNWFLFRELNRDDTVSVDEMQAYYEDHLADYARPANVDWQQIQITYFGEAGKAECLNRIRRAQQELQDGVPVADVVRKYSDGSTKKEGGARKSMVSGTLTDSKLEELLFEMPRGQWSEIYEGPSEFQLVRVQKRTLAGAASYEEVQDNIRQKLNAKKVQSLAQQMIADADIEYDFIISELYQDSER